jgi:hypothetical protein
VNVCPRCDVELSPDATFCPLCGTCLDPANPAPRLDYIDPDDAEHLTDLERRKIGLEVLSVSAIIATLAVSAVNLATAGALTWALYPLVSLGFAWVLGAALIGAFRPRILAFLLPGAALLLFLVGLDLIEGGLSWAPRLAIPIALDAEIAFGLAAFLSSRARRKGANVAAFFFIATSAVCVGIEVMTDLLAGGPVRLGWSSIVGFALVPVSVFLLYLHHRLGQKASLRKLFRL